MTGSMEEVIGRRLAAMTDRIIELERRHENSERDGVITEVDHAERLAKVELGTDKNSAITPWLPWMERGGDIQEGNPPAIGEPVTVSMPGGEMSIGRIHLGAPSNRAGRPGSKGGQHVRTIGGTSLEQTGDAITTHGTNQLGGTGGKRVARLGDKVQVGSQIGTIIEGSATVSAVD